MVSTGRRRSCSVKKVGFQRASACGGKEIAILCQERPASCVTYSQEKFDMSGRRPVPISQPIDGVTNCMRLLATKGGIPYASSVVEAICEVDGPLAVLCQVFPPSAVRGQATEPPVEAL